MIVLLLSGSKIILSSHNMLHDLEISRKIYSRYPAHIEHAHYVVNTRVHIYNLGLDAGKPVLVGLQTTKMQTACTSLQSDQYLCYLLIGKHHI